MTKKFTREDRYIVIKCSDVQCLSKDDQQRLSIIEARVDRQREIHGKEPLSCVVVEHDWPEFEPTWNAIEARVTGQPAEQQKDYIKGFADCREYMAKFVEPQSAEIAASIRANWNPDLGADPMVVQCENCGGIGAVGELVQPDISEPERCDSCAETGVWRITK